MLIMHLTWSELAGGLACVILLTFAVWVSSKEQEWIWRSAAWGERKGQAWCARRAAKRAAAPREDEAE